MPCVIRPAYTLGGAGGGIAYNIEEFEEIAERGLSLSMKSEVLVERVDRRLEGIRDGGDARPQGQRRHRLLDRELRSDGRPHRRLDHRRAGADAHRPRIPANARRVASPSFARSASRPAAPTSSSRSSPRRADGDHRDEPARVAQLGARLEGDRLPDRARSPRSSPSATRSTRSPTTSRKETPASFEPTIDYVVTKIPRFAFEKFPGSDPTLTTQMKSVGEVMAIGRNFTESLQKGAARSGNRALGSRPRSQGSLLSGDMPSRDRDPARKLRTPNADRIYYLRYAFRAGMSVEEVGAGDPHRSLVPPARSPSCVEFEEHASPPASAGDEALTAELFARRSGAATAIASYRVAFGKKEEEIRAARARWGSRRASSWSTPAPPSSSPRPLLLFDLRDAGRARASAIARK